MRLHKAKIWINAARPKTLWAAIAPVIIGTAMAYSDEKMHIVASLVALVAAILIQIGTNFANDYFDLHKKYQQLLQDIDHRSANLIQVLDSQLT